MWGDLLAVPHKVLQPPRTIPPNTEVMPAMEQRKRPDHPSQTRDLRLGKEQSGGEGKGLLAGLEGLAGVPGILP